MRYPLHWLSSADKRDWFGDYAQHRRHETLLRLHGLTPVHALDF